MRVISRSALTRSVSGKRILVDSNIIIYLTDSIVPYEKLSRHLFEIIEKGDAFACFSSISVAEVMQGPIKTNKAKIALELKDYLLNFPNSICQDIDKVVLDRIGGDNRVNWSRLRTTDSLIIASGLVNTVDRIVSNDRHFRTAISGDFVISFDLT